jgi:hypothetical protein
MKERNLKREWWTSDILEKKMEVQDDRVQQKKIKALHQERGKKSKKGLVQSSNSLHKRRCGTKEII